MRYKIDFKRLVILLLPVFLRKKLVISLVNALVTPVRDLHERFMAYRDAISKRLDFTGETRHLEKILNDEFPLAGDGISIKTVNSAAGNVSLHLKSEIHQPVYLYHATRGEHVVLVKAGTGSLHEGVDFVVNIPLALDTPGNVQKIKRIVDYYKMAGKQYKIETYG